MPITLPDILLHALVDELNSPTTITIVLGGSYARGDATPYSDVDIVHFVTVAPSNPHRTYRYIDGRLISIATRTLDWYRTALTQPPRAIFAVPALRHARILLDKDGTFHAFQQELQTFTWEPLQESANQYISHMIMNSAEDVHKLLSTQIRSRTSRNLCQSAECVTKVYLRQMQETTAIMEGRVPGQ